MTRPPCQFLEWDSAFFGFPIARVTASRMSHGDCRQVLDWCAAERIRCLYLLAAADDAATIRAAEDHGFHLTDMRVTLSCHTGRVAESLAPVAVRRARKEDLLALAAIAASSHTDSRFYFDPGFPRERCDALYVAWITNSFHGYAQMVLVAELDHRAAGYITCHWEGATGRIGLIAVADWARGRGGGRSLVRASQSLFHAEGLQEVTVVTQGRNLTSQRMYQRCGFQTRSVELWYHRWFPLE
jgi:dTDP-4-amino-4,6-dideoxy-D-galactose acyltransferase